MILTPTIIAIIMLGVPVFLLPWRPTRNCFSGAIAFGALYSGLFMGLLLLSGMRDYLMIGYFPWLLVPIILTVGLTGASYKWKKNQWGPTPTIIGVFALVGDLALKYSLFQILQALP